MKTTLTTCLLGLAIALNGTAAIADAIDYPDGYRLWAHVKSMTIHKGHPLETPFLGIHHVYANEKALAGLKNGQFDDGSKLVFDQLQSHDADKASVEGDRVLIGMMVKDRQRFPKTNGWGYEAWSKNSRTERLVSDDGVSCHACHAQQKDRDFVFSEWRG